MRAALRRVRVHLLPIVLALSEMTRVTKIQPHWTRGVFSLLTVDEASPDGLREFLAGKLRHDGEGVVRVLWAV